MKLLIFIIIIGLVIFLWLIDNISVFNNFKMKFTNFLMKHYNICMFIIGFLIKFLFSNLFSLNKDLSFILFAEDVVKKKGDITSYGIIIGERRVPKSTEHVILPQNTLEVEQEEGFWDKKVNILGYEVSRKVVIIGAITLTVAIIGAYFYFRSGNTTTLTIDDDQNPPDNPPQKIVSGEKNPPQRIVLGENNPPRVLTLEETIRKAELVEQLKARRHSYMHYMRLQHGPDFSDGIYDESSDEVPMWNPEANNVNNVNNVDDVDVNNVDDVDVNNHHEMDGHDFLLEGEVLLDDDGNIIPENK